MKGIIYWMYRIAGKLLDKVDGGSVERGAGWLRRALTKFDAMGVLDGFVAYVASTMPRSLQFLLDVIAYLGLS